MNEFFKNKNRLQIKSCVDNEIREVIIKNI
jgi:hypothetical protein